MDATSDLAALHSAASSSPPPPEAPVEPRIMEITPFQALRMAVALLKWKRARSQAKAQPENAALQTHAAKFLEGLNNCVEGVETEVGMRCAKADVFSVPGIEAPEGYVPVHRVIYLDKMKHRKLNAQLTAQVKELKAKLAAYEPQPVEVSA